MSSLTHPLYGCTDSVLRSITYQLKLIVASNKYMTRQENNESWIHVAFSEPGPVQQSLSEVRQNHRGIEQTEQERSLIPCEKCSNSHGLRELERLHGDRQHVWINWLLSTNVSTYVYRCTYERIPWQRFVEHALWREPYMYSEFHAYI